MTNKAPYRFIVTRPTPSSKPSARAIGDAPANRPTSPVCATMDFVFKHLSKIVGAGVAAYALYQLYQKFAVKGAVVETEQHGGELVARVRQAARATASVHPATRAAHSGPHVACSPPAAAAARGCHHARNQPHV